MSGLDKILEHITSEAQAEAEQIIAAAKADAEKIISSGKEDADAVAAAIAKQSEMDVASAIKRIQSAAELKEKRIILQAKQEQIENIFTEALKSLTELNDTEYFEVIKKMISKYASGESGKIRFSAADLKRMPADMAAVAAQKNLTVDSEPIDIVGGFVLSYGDIEENCSFDVLISTSREELQDKIGQLLFN